MNALQARKVLVVDDDKDVIDLIENVLSMNNYEAIATTQWTEALHALQNQQLDLVLLDLNMPTIDGTSLLKFLREQGHEVPVIVVSAYIDEDIRRELTPLGVRAFVDKPFEIQHLAEQISTVLTRHLTDADPTTKPSPSEAPPSPAEQHTPGKLSPKRPSRHSPPINVPRQKTSSSFKKEMGMLFIIAIICLVVTGFIMLLIR